MSKIARDLHLKTFLKGIEAAVVIIVAVMLYDFLKEEEITHIKNLNIDVKYHKLITKILHFFTIFLAEIIVVYLLIFIFETDF